VRAHRGGVTSRHRPGERVRGRAVLQRFQRSARKGQQGSARDRFRSAGRVLERLHRAREERHLRAGGENCGGVVERARRIAHRDRRHPQRSRDLLQRLQRAGVRPRDARGSFAQRSWRAVARHGAERMQRSGASSSVHRGPQDVEAESAGAVRDELAAPQERSDAPAEAFDGRIGDGEEDDLGVAQPLEVGFPSRLLRPVPGQHDRDARRA